MKIDITEMIEKEFSEYMQGNKDWNEKLKSTKFGVCDLCSSKGKITEHHPIPKRVFPKSNPALINFLDKLKIDVCNDCHNKIHPENKWKKDLLKFQDIVNLKVNDVEKKVKQEIEKSNKEVSCIKQELNNIILKYNNKTKDLQDKNTQINDLKYKVKSLTHDIKVEKERTKSKELMDRGLGNEATLFFNLSSYFADTKQYEKKLKDFLLNDMNKERDVLVNKKNMQPRDLNILIKKLQIKSNKIRFSEYTQKQIDEGLGVLQEVVDRLEDEVFEECFSIPNK